MPRKKGGKKHVSQKHLCEQLLMAKKTERSTLGVLYTGYLEKFNPDGWTEKAKRRFVVLTHVGLHWFKVGCGASSHFSGQRCRRSAADDTHGMQGLSVPLTVAPVVLRGGAEGARLRPVRRGEGLRAGAGDAGRGPGRQQPHTVLHRDHRHVQVSGAAACHSPILPGFQLIISGFLASPSKSVYPLCGV